MEGSSGICTLDNCADNKTDWPFWGGTLK